MKKIIAAVCCVLMLGCTPVPDEETTTTDPSGSSTTSSSSTSSSTTSSTATASTTTASTTTAPTTTQPSGRWKPTPGLTWQWQLTGNIDTSVNAQVFDVDLFDVSAATVLTLKNKGSKVICYFSAGSYENWRPDKNLFPTSVRGNSNGWPGENWLDIRQINVLESIMGARMDLCKSKGFDAVEPDNIDGYTNSTGFSLTGAHQLTYNRMLARLAHDRGLSIGLKNDVDQVQQLVGDFDFAINEECVQWNECNTLKPFISANKAVFHTEYARNLNFCSTTKPLGFSSINKRLDLDAWRQVCP